MHEQAMAREVLRNRLSCLSSRELEILPLVVTGHANKEIARHLGISHRTVEIHRARILTKTGASNLLELVRFYEDCKLPPGPKQDSS
jgi:FixJ family two-component response regulator